MLKVTFDSNVWRGIATPGRFPKDPARAALDQIRQAIIDGRAAAFLSETVFTLEAIKRVDRKAAFMNHKPSVIFEERATDDSISITFSISPDTSSHPGTNPILEAHLQDALALGFRLLRVPRIGGITNPDLLPSYFAAEPPGAVALLQERMGTLLREIEMRGCGMAHAKAAAGPHSAADPWYAGLQNLPASDEDRFASAIAEWADGDSIASHYAYQNDVFCSRDVGKTGGSDSVLSPVHREWLSSTFAIAFASPEEIAARL